MPNLLYITNVAGAKMAFGFSASSILAARELNYNFHAVSNRSLATKEQILEDEKTYNVHLHHADICRSPFSLKNITAHKQVCSLIRNEKVDLIHCHTPIGGMIGRLAGKKCRVKKIIYQAHGFHFYKGAPKKNWLLYYPAERLLARFTDAIITINKEDFEAAKRFKLKRGGMVYFVHGVGITTADFQNIPADAGKEIRNDLGIRDDEILLISVGELNKNKNNAVIIKAISKLKNPKIKYALCGVGEEKQALVSLCKELGVEKQVQFLGFRNDVAKLYKAADIFVMPSLREGLSRSMMEAMASGLPCVASAIRGNVDLIEEGKNGYLCAPKDAKSFSEAILKLASSKELRSEISKKNLEKIKEYDISVVEKEMMEIYRDVLKA